MSDIKDVVKEEYGQVALRVVAGQAKGHRGPSSCCSPVAGAVDPITASLDLGSGGGIDVFLSAKPAGRPARPTAWT